MKRSIRLTPEDLKIEARNVAGRCELQLAELDKFLNAGWQVNKVAAYPGRPGVIFLHHKNINGKTTFMAVMPYGRIERQVNGGKSLRVQLPR